MEPFTQLTADFGARFRLTALLPAALPVLVGTTLVLAGAPATAPTVARLVHDGNQIGVVGVAALLIGVIMLSVLAAVAQTTLVRLLEGYWGDSRLARWVHATAVKRLQGRRDMLVGATELHTTKGQTATPDEEARGQRALEQLSRWPDHSRVQPTMLGCALRAAEDRAGDRYGLDAVLLWPRLYPLVAAPLRVTLDSARDQMDLLAMTTWSTAASGLLALGLLAAHGWWLLFPLVMAGFSYLSYRGAVAAAATYGVHVQASFDLHRFDLLTALHLPLPADTLTEPAAYEAAQQLLSIGEDRDPKRDPDKPPLLIYRHPEPINASLGSSPTDRPGLRMDDSQPSDSIS